MPGERMRLVTSCQFPLLRSTSGTSASRALARWSSLSSQAQTSAPDACSARAAARPDLPRPSTATGKPAKKLRSIRGAGTGTAELLSQLEGGEAGEGQDGGDDPEADDDGRLGPALLLEVVVQRRHADDALAGQLEGGDLDDDGDRLQHEEAADDAEHQLVIGARKSGEEGKQRTVRVDNGGGCHNE